MSFKILFWNIENYVGDPPRTIQVVDHIRAFDPDILGFSEIKDKAALRSLLHTSLENYDFGVTDGAEGIELLAGWKRNEFQQAIFTQRREFKAGNEHLRPGSLLSVRRNDIFYNVLFLYTDSGTRKRDYDNRQEMFEKIWGLKSKLDEITDDTEGTRFLALGDLNTMGRRRSGINPAISGNEEITDLGTDAVANDMALQPKNHNQTWAEVESDGRLKRSSNLDHIITTTNLTLKDFGDGAPVQVRGWVDVSNNADRLIFVEHISDHCSVECEIIE